MRIISRKTLRLFWEKHRNSEQILKSWFSEIESLTQCSPTILAKRYPKSSFVGKDRVVFRVKGNNYRIVAQINYDYQILLIRFVGTHSQYDKIDVKTVKL